MYKTDLFLMRCDITAIADAVANAQIATPVSIMIILIILSELISLIFVIPNIMVIHKKTNTVDITIESTICITLILFDIFYTPSNYLSGNPLIYLSIVSSI